MIEYANAKEVDHLLEGSDGPFLRSFDDIKLIAAQKRRLNILAGMLALSLIVNFLVLGLPGALKRVGQCDVGDKAKNWVKWKGVPPVWSPAQDVIEHEHKVFPWFTEVSAYTGPRTPEVDRAWAKLYMPHFWQALPRSAIEENFVNHTSRPIGDIEEYGEPRYAVSLDVFHQLHCLDRIRMMINPSHELDSDTSEGHHHPDLKFPPQSRPGEPPYDHINHCINSIRESLMCQPDITPVPWQWHADEKKYRVGIDVVHTCVNFDKIQEYVEERKLNMLLNVTQYVPDSWDPERQLPQLASWD